jgi:hypothetical protein
MKKHEYVLLTVEAIATNPMLTNEEKVKALAGLRKNDDGKGDQWGRRLPSLYVGMFCDHTLASEGSAIWTKVYNALQEQEAEK